MENIQIARPNLKVHADAMPTAFSWQAARWVSTVFSPPLLGALGAVLLGFSLNSPGSWGWTLAYAFASIIGPTLLVIWMLRRGDISDFHLRERAERIKPMIGFLLLFLLSWLFFQVAGAPRVFQVLAAVGVLQSAVILLVTLAWKISGHCAGAAGFSVYLWGLYGAAAAPAILFIPLVIWARVTRNRHDMAQSLAGAAFGAACMLLALAALAPHCPGAGFQCV